MKRVASLKFLSTFQRIGANINWVLIAVTLLGLLLRSMYGGGMDNEQSFSFARSAISLASRFNQTSLPIQEHLVELRSETGIHILIYSMPIALSYMLFGINEFSSTFFPLLASLTVGILIFKILSWKVNHSTAILGIFFWAIFPPAIFYSTVLSLFGLVTSLVVLSIFLSYRWGEKKSNRVLMLIGLCFLITVLINFLFGLLLLFSSIYILLLTYFSAQRIWSGVIGVVGITLAFFIEHTSLNFVIWYRELISLPEAWILLPLLLISLVGLLNNNRISNFVSHILFLLVLGFLASIYGFLCPSFSFICKELISTNTPETHMLPMFVPMVMVIACYLGDLSASYNIKIGLLFATILLGGAAIIINLTPFQFIPIYSQPLHIVGITLIHFSTISMSVFILLVMLTPFSNQLSASRWKALSTVILITMFGFATLELNWNRKKSLSNLSQTVQQLFGDINSQNLSLPIYVIDPSLEFHLQYASAAFSHRGDLHIGLQIILINESQLELVKDGYILLSKDTLSQNTLQNWWQVSSYSNYDGSQISLFQTLEGINSQDWLTKSLLTAEKETAGPEDYMQLSSAFMHVDQPCESFIAWMQAQTRGASIRFIPAISIDECFTEGQSLYASLLEAWFDTRRIQIFEKFTPSNSETFFEVQSGIPLYSDWRNHEVQIPLDQDSFYLFSLELNSDTTPTIAHYIRLNGSESFIGKQVYPQWQTVQLLLSTHNWNEQPSLITYSPVLLGPHSSVFISNLQITQISISDVVTK